MSAETELIVILRASSTLMLKVTGVFLNAADELTPLPYIVITATHDPDLLMSGQIDLDHVTFTLACWGAGAAVAEGVADTAQGLLDQHDEYGVLARTGGFDEQTANDVAVLTVDRWM